MLTAGSTDVLCWKQAVTWVSRDPCGNIQGFAIDGNPDVRSNVCSEGVVFGQLLPCDHGKLITFGHFSAVLREISAEFWPWSVDCESEGKIKLNGKSSLAQPSLLSLAHS